MPLTPKQQHDIALRLACEWGFRQAEKGHNLDWTLHEFSKMLERQDAAAPHSASKE